jgi:MFS superfamily sulfate permease-like transporter
LLVILLFASRVNFFFGGAFFSAVFFRHLPELEVFPSLGQTAIKALYLAAVLFGLFCYSLELERLGKAIDDPT